VAAGGSGIEHHAIPHVKTIPDAVQPLPHVEMPGRLTMAGAHPALLVPFVATDALWGQRSGAVLMDLRSTSNHEKPSDPPAVSSWGRPSGLRPGFRPARSFSVTSGRFFNGAAGLPPGAELYLSSGARTFPIFHRPLVKFPPSDSLPKIISTASSGRVTVVSIRISACSGASYGESIPVKCLRSPRRAFL
jgi:hypothetical protein